MNYQIKPYNPTYREERHKTFTIEQLRMAKELRDEYAKDGRLCPPLPCPYIQCMACEGYRQFWEDKLNIRTLKLL